MSEEDVRPGAGDYGRITITIQVRIRHRATETLRELREWLTSSLEDILVEGDLWKSGSGSPDPDIPKISEVLGDPWEESPVRVDGDLVRLTTGFSRQIRAWFEERRESRISTPKETVSLCSGQVGWSEGRVMVECLQDWLEEGLSNSQIEYCSWGPEDENGEPKKGSLNLTELSEEELTEARLTSDETLSRSWEHFHQIGSVEVTTLVHLSNPPPREFHIEDHLYESLSRLQRRLDSTQEIYTLTFMEFLSAHFQVKWKEEVGRGSSPSPYIHPPKDFIKGMKGRWRKGLKDFMW